MREGHAVNIHMFCARRPGILLSTMTALDSLGLDIEQAVISCFNGFAMDVFRAEVCGHHANTISSENSDGFNSTKLPNPPLLTPASSCLSVASPQQCADGPGMVPEEIKAVLMHTAGLHNAM
jgi:hypothetical protein